MDQKDKLPQKKLTEQSHKLFTELEGRKPKPNTLDDNTIELLEKAVLIGYELGYQKFYTVMCDKCKYRSATCFGPGAFCDDCSMEEFEIQDGF
jgi:hypothetical protein